MRLTLYYICAFLLLVSFEAYSKIVFRSDYKSIQSGWYKLHLPAEWREARLRCHLEGAVLASPLDSELLSTFQSTSQEQQRCIYTGIHATFSRGDYFSIEGVRLSSIPVVMDSSNNQECVAFTERNIVTDVNCTEILPYICYKKNNKDLFVTGCGTTDTQYTLDSRTGSCYKFHAIPNTWSRAFMTCAAEGGHLAILNSDVEAQVLKELYAKYPDHAIFSYDNKYAAHIGYHDWGERGNWRTIHGQTLIEAGYNKWSAGQPDNFAPGEFCGAIFRNGLLDDIWCDKYFPFICEKQPTALRPDLDLEY